MAQTGPPRLGDICGRHKPPAQRSGSFHKAESLPVWIENLNSSILRGHLRTGETCYPPLGTQGAAAARVSQVDQVRLRPAGDEVRARGWEAAAHARGLTFRPERSSSALSTRQRLATPFAPTLLCSGPRSDSAREPVRPAALQQRPLLGLLVAAPRGQRVSRFYPNAA